MPRAPSMAVGQPPPSDTPARPGAAAFRREGEVLVIALSGRLDTSASGVWRESLNALERERPRAARLDFSGADYVDTSALGLAVELRQRQAAHGGSFEVTGLAPGQAALLELFATGSDDSEEVQAPRSLPVEIGKAGYKIWRDTRTMVAFVGEFALAAAWALRHPRALRWRDFWTVAEKAGANALFIVALIGFLMGLIMSFQSAMPLRQFGAEIYVANFLGLSMLRELGPLVTAILLAGRSGSAFAAEIGTMRVNEELNALTTMGLDPMRFLVLTRVGAAMLVTPLLVMYFNVFAMVGGAIVMLTLGFPLVTYMNQVVASVGMGDMAGGLFKSLVFSLLVAGVGCQKGLATGSGAAAVGDSATSAVVYGIILIAVTDGIFAVIFYALGW